MATDPQHPVRGDLKVWGVWKDKVGPTWTNEPSNVPVLLGNDPIASEATVVGMTPGEDMEALWPNWKVSCRKVSQEWFDGLPVADES